MFKKIILLTFVFLLLGVLLAQAANISIYIKNEPYKGDYIIKNGSLFMPIEKFLKKMYYTYKQEADYVYILPFDSNFKYFPLSQTDMTYVYNDKEFKASYLTKDGVLFVAVREMSKNLGVLCIYNPETRIIDMVMPAVSADQILGAAEGKIITKEDKEGKDKTSSTGQAVSESSGSDPIKTKVDYFQDYDPQHQDLGGDLRGTVTITNTSDKEVKNVVVILHIQDMDGQDLTKEIWTIGDMKAGAETQKYFTWSNPNPLLAFKPFVEVKHD